MKKPVVRSLQILKSESITTNMQRLTLGGEALIDFPSEQEGVYVKLMFPQVGAVKPLVRTYTIIQQRSELLELDIDFVLHPEPHGPASTLAIEAKAGDTVLLSGPGKKKDFFVDADWFLIAGDMTALPAISVILKSLPNTCKGYVVIEVLDEADQQTLEMPVNMTLHWVHGKNNNLETAVTSLPFLDGKPSVWVACEFSTMRSLRKYFKFEKQVDKSALYISSYWKKGLAEDKHKIVKREDSDAQE